MIFFNCAFKDRYFFMYEKESLIWTKVNPSQNHECKLKQDDRIQLIFSAMLFEKCLSCCEAGIANISTVYT